MGDLQERTRFEPAEVEPRILARWLEAGFVHPEPAGSAEENFSIAIPPPNVTGALHMGHALNSTIQDVLTRSNRMRGRRSKWILGTDHAGIATQRQVEKLLESEGTSRIELGREPFAERVWEWREKYGGQIIEQFKRLGATCDYEDERFTLDPQYVQAVLKVFVELYEQGLIYRDNYMANWDPGLRSAISDLEVEEREGIVDTLYSIAYPLACGDGEVIVATVRPETMLADTALAVHPDDERFAHLVGQEVVLPLVGRRLKIIADDYVKMDFGTGALKITPGHDPNDFEIGRRHGLEEIGVIGEDGLMSAAAGEHYAGQTVLEARDRVVADLEQIDAIRGREEFVHTVPFSQRSGERVEPLISLQWFMRMDELAGPAIDAVTSGRVTIHPASQSRRYVDWLENIRPWCISRQLWWGHQIPVWYRGDETYVGATAPEGEDWEQDPDVLDTWFSSALWPFATLGWPEKTPQLQAFYPTDVLSTGRDILFLWVARMVMMGLRFANDIPFEHVYVHSIIQAPDGRRMSKSLGTGIDPLALVEGGPRPPVFDTSSRPPGDFPAYGADAVRFGLLAMSSTQDVRFSEEKVEPGQKLANKLYNATRFVVLRVGDDVDPARRAAPQPQPQTVEDRWILSRLQAIKADTQARVDGFDFAKAALGLYDFIYGELCDWYLEIVKPRLADDAEPDDRAALGATLLHILRETLATAHPVIPFVTEELWRLLPGSEGMLATGTMPAPDPALADPAAEAAMARAIEAVRILRGWRDSVGVRPGAVIPAVLNAAGYETTSDRVGALARCAFVNGGKGDGAVEVANVAIPGGTVGVLESGDVDLGVAERRLEEQRATLRDEIGRAGKKLSNEGFVAKAPPAVVQAERAKLGRLRAELEGL
ncbi:MAG: valine--tRNA ligase [Solirubrobacteraceae bacterium]